MLGPWRASVTGTSSSVEIIASMSSPIPSLITTWSSGSAAALTGAAVAVVHHARKSTTADIVSDPSGAGWTRYASTIASLSKKEKEPGVWLEAVCRSFPAPQPRRL